MEESAKLMEKHKWIQWRGNNRFYFKGRFVTGPIEEQMSVASTHILIIFVAVTWCMFYMPLFFEINLVGVSLIVLIELIACYYFLIQAQYTDPGIVNKEIEFLEQDLQNKGQNDYFYQNTLIYKPRYCETCNVIRPPKASHCGICNNCVRVFDHHCTFINNCVGVRNMRPFVFLVYGSFFVSTQIFMFSIYFFLKVAELGFIQDSTRYYYLYISFALASPFFIVYLRESISMQTRMIAAFASAVVIFGGFTYFTRFENGFKVTPMPGLLGHISLMFNFLVWNLVKRYNFLISRGWTEKEKVARKRQSETMQVEDDKYNKGVSYKECYENYKYFLTYKKPKSIFRP